MATTIQVSDETWQRLNQMKEPGESFDDVIAAVIEGSEITA